MEQNRLMAFFTRKRIVRLLILLAALLVLWWLKHIFFSAEKPAYLTAAVKRGNIEATVLATGIIKPYQLVAVGARATGRIIALKVRAGSEVKQGDLLAEIDPTTQENDLKNKEAALALRQAGLEQQQAQLILAQQNMARQQNMIASHAVSKADFDAAAAQVKVALAEIDAYKAQIAQAQTDVDMARLNLGYTRVTAPFSGTVLATVVQEGQNVNAVQSAPTIVILGNLSVMTVRAQISEADIAHVKKGQDLYFNTIGNPARRYRGTLEEIEPAPETIRSDISFNASASATSSSQAVYYNGVFNIENADLSLRTYMTAEVHIILGHAENTLLVPADALQQAGKDGANTVRVLPSGSGKPVTKRVQIGLKTQALAQVLSGLSEGDRVITSEVTGAAAKSAGSGRKIRF